MFEATAQGFNACVAASPSRCETRHVAGKPWPQEYAVPTVFSLRQNSICSFTAGDGRGRVNPDTTCREEQSFGG